MKKMFIVALAAFSLGGLAGCSQSDAHPEAPAAPSAAVKSLNASDEVKGEAAQRPDGCTFDSAQFAGKVRGCSYAGRGQLLVEADGLYLYDCGTGKVIAEAPAELSSFEAMPFEGGLALSGTADGGAQVLVYDDRLVLEEAIALEGLLPDDHVLGGNCVAVSADGGRLAVAGMRGLYLYDRGTGVLETLFSVNPDENLSGIELLALSGVAFAPGDERIVFSGDGVAAGAGAGEEGSPVWGTVDVDGEGLRLDWLEADGIEEMLRVQGRAFFPPSITAVDGGVPWLDLAAGEAHRVAFSGADEGRDGIYASEQGKYVATATLGDCLTLRIYAVDSGQLVATETIAAPDPLYLGRTPSVLIMEDSPCAIVVLGSGLDELNTLAVTVPFGA